MTQHPKRVEHMARRAASGLRHHEIAQEYGMSRGHVSKLLKKHNDNKMNNDADEEC